MNHVSVVIPSLNKPHSRLCADYLNCIPFPHDVYWMSEQKSWPEAVNAGFEKSKGNDVLLMDDDIFLMPSTFAGFDDYYDMADIFGFKLLFTDGTIQHGGGIYRNGIIGHMGHGQEDVGQCNQKLLTCHLTTSLIYIKSHVIEKLKGMATDYPGMQFEDVDFCMRAIQAGFKLMYLPSPAIHLESASKKHLPMFKIKFTQNMLEVQRRFFADPNFTAQLSEYPKPI